MNNFDTENNKALRTDIFANVRNAYIAHMKKVVETSDEEEIIQHCKSKQSDPNLVIKVTRLKKSDFTDEFLDDRKEDVKEILELANQTFQLEEKLNNAKNRVYTMYESNKEYIIVKAEDTKAVVLDELESTKNALHQEYPEFVDSVSDLTSTISDTVGESSKIVTEKSKEIGNTVLEAVSESGKIISDKSKQISDSATEMAGSIFDKVKDTAPDIKSKGKKVVKEIENITGIDAALLNLEGVLESKEQRISRVENWLSHSKDSISIFAGNMIPKSDEDIKLADAALNQLKAEHCYNIYVDSLKNCQYYDNICLLQNYTLRSQCDKYSKSAAAVFRKLD